MRVELWANHVGGAIGNYLGNPMGTSWEHIGNMIGTRGKKISKKSISPN
jgi:hypothetical protein